MTNHDVSDPRSGSRGYNAIPACPLGATRVKAGSLLARFVARCCNAVRQPDGV
ncbi:MAG: hypothetical protein HC933_04305 [Pleurocapsa sp. SU_196_0]|nr:hypothetical protein [Pleurocapsa sp. SU_196_0]